MSNDANAKCDLNEKVDGCENSIGCESSVGCEKGSSCDWMRSIASHHNLESLDVNEDANHFRMQLVVMSCDWFRLSKCLRTTCD